MCTLVYAGLCSGEGDSPILPARKSGQSPPVRCFIGFLRFQVYNGLGRPSYRREIDGLGRPSYRREIDGLGRPSYKKTPLFAPKNARAICSWVNGGNDDGILQDWCSGGSEGDSPIFAARKSGQSPVGILQDSDREREITCWAMLTLPCTSMEGRCMIGGYPRRNLLAENEFGRKFTQITARKGAAKFQGVVVKGLTMENRPRNRVPSGGEMGPARADAVSQVEAGQRLTTRGAAGAHFANGETCPEKFTLRY